MIVENLVEPNSLQCNSLDRNSLQRIDLKKVSPCALFTLSILYISSPILFLLFFIKMYQLANIKYKSLKKDYEYKYCLTF